MAPSPNTLQLKLDSLKLSLLERQRSLALNLPSTKQNTQITQSLTQLRQGLDELESEQHSDPFRDDDDAPDAETARLRRGYEEAYLKFHGSAAPPSTTISTRGQPYTDDDDSATRPAPSRLNKSVRFRDTPLTATDTPDDSAAQASRAALFSETDRYRDEPAPPDHSQQDNQQIHAYHTRALRDQDEQLDILGQSLGRQKVLGLQMGDELDDQGQLLDDVERGVDRHADTLTRARRRLEGVARKGKGNWSWVTIGILVCVLVLLIVVLK